MNGCCARSPPPAARRCLQSAGRRINVIRCLEGGGDGQTGGGTEGRLMRPRARTSLSTYTSLRPAAFQRPPPSRHGGRHRPLAVRALGKQTGLQGSGSRRLSRTKPDGMRDSPAGLRLLHLLHPLAAYGERLSAAASRHLGPRKNMRAI